MSATKRPFHETVAANLIERLEQGTAPWQRPWTAKQQPHIPYNPNNNRRYKGINTLNLMAQGYSDPRWMTYKQTAAVDAQVQKGEKGTLVQFWKFNDEKNKTDENGKVVKDAQGSPVKIKVKLERPKVFYASVFNGEQIQGLPPLVVEPISEAQQWQNQARAENLLNASGAKIHHDQANRAFYSVGKDSIHLPEKEQFDEAGKYYATALHELGHWTGHPSRLNRDVANPFGSDAYAKEELRAEISSMILGEELGIGHDPSQHTAYVKSWGAALNNDPLEIFRAAADAEKILTMLLGFELQQEHAMKTEHELDDTAQLSWSTLQDTAKELGFMAVLTSNKKDLTSPFIIHYHNPGGMPAPVQSLLQTEGSVHTGAEGETVKETDFTVDNEQQRDALLVALTPYQNIKQIEDIHPQAPNQSTHAPQGTEIENVYLEVPFKEKNQVKALGAKWDKHTRHWCVPKGTDLTPFNQWPVTTPTTSKRFLAVPYEERNKAKAAGAKWDKQQSAWYINVGKDDSLLEKCRQWLPENQQVEATPVLDAREEFADKLAFMGFDVSGEHPIMDGQKHRCRVDTDKNGVSHNAGAGMYVASLDDHPWGYAINNKTGEETKWKAKGYNLSPAEKAKYQAISAQKQQALQDIKTKEQTNVAKAITRLIATCTHPTGNEKYITDKQLTTAKLLCVPAPSALPNDPGILIGENWKASKALREAHPDKLIFTTGELLVPAIDGQGHIRTAQTIQANGTKMFPRGGQKTGTFHIVGGELDDIARVSTLIIAEGLATADTISQASKQPVISAFDAGNVIEVAKELHRKFPEKTLLICGDDDAHLSLTEIKGNVGRNKAAQAAELTNGKTVFPIFAPGEQDYPNHLPPMTPQRWRGDDVSDEERHAITGMKSFTDFNDLKLKSKLGIEGVKRQLSAVLHQIKEQQQDIPMHTQTQQKSHGVTR
jgi:putative DNA primase/helicase